MNNHDLIIFMIRTLLIYAGFWAAMMSSGYLVYRVILQYKIERQTKAAVAHFEDRIWLMMLAWPAVVIVMLIGQVFDWFILLLSAIFKKRTPK